jgi:hypothetical protein
MGERFLVVLDPASATGRMFADDNDGFMNGDGMRAPILDCRSADIDHHIYALVVREPKKRASTHQSLFVPHSHIALIHRYAEAERQPVGFQTSVA